MVSAQPYLTPIARQTDGGAAPEIQGTATGIVGHRGFQPEAGGSAAPRSSVPRTPMRLARFPDGDTPQMPWLDVLPEPSQELLRTE